MQKICRNATYYTDRFKQNLWCEQCYNNLDGDDEKPVQLDDGRETKKSLLLKMKNDSMPEEAWVQCDDCHDWNHQICALFNGTNSKSGSYTCPKCYIKDRQKNNTIEPCCVIKDAKDLPHCHLSTSIEDGLLKTLLKAYKKVAEDRGCKLSQVEKAEGLTVRVVSSLEKKHKVREEMRRRYLKSDYPLEFPVTTKCIVLFQKIHGADVLLFEMYVYEYGDDCPGPNRRRVYISYLDSVRYLEPSSYRTITYQCVIIEYLRFVKMRGFHTAHIWSCPPTKGDEYIFHCHPSHQLTPNDDLLCSWYMEVLRKAKDEGIVLETRALYDEYFKNNAINPHTGDTYDPTSLPYFDGDYIPGEIEKIIKDLSEEESRREECKLKVTLGSISKGRKNKNTSTQKEGKRKGTRSNPGSLVNQSRDKVMNRLDLVLSRMKKNFMVVQLLSDDFIQAVERGDDVKNWTDRNQKTKQQNDGGAAGKNPDVLRDRLTPKESTSGNVIGKTTWKIVGDTKDNDPVMEHDCLDTRLQFLNYCQRNNYQFDELRRAKHTTLMLLAYLHNPRAEQEQQIKAHLQVIIHAASCSGPPGCTSTNCQRMKQLFKHIRSCGVTYKRGCKICTRLFMLLTKHARDCDEVVCPVPFCDLIKERTRLLLKQQQMIDDRRRDAQNDRLRQTAHE